MLNSQTAKLTGESVVPHGPGHRLEGDDPRDGLLQGAPRLGKVHPLRLQRHVFRPNLTLDLEIDLEISPLGPCSQLLTVARSSWEAKLWEEDFQGLSRLIPSLVLVVQALLSS